MGIVIFFEILTFVSFMVPLLFYLCYGALLVHYNRQSRLRKRSYRYIFPSVTLIVPVYNEETIIERKINNINETEYPHDKIEVIFVDGDSSDRTPEIVLRQALDSKISIRLIRQKKREGYTRALIEGIKNSQSEIVVATDAASYYYSNTILNLTRHFTDSEIGAVTGKEVVLGKEGDVGPVLEKSYRFFYDFIRVAETEIDSTPDSKGEVLAIRKDICDKILEKLVRSPNASFDTCVPYQAKIMGYRTIFDEDAKYYENAPASFSDRMKQQVRRATLLIGGLLLFKGLLFSKKSGRFGLLILPAHFIMDCVLPSFFMVGALSFIILSIVNPLVTVPVWLAVLILLSIGKSRSFIISFIQSQFALFAALFKLAKREKTLFIESIPSTRTT